MISSVIAWAAFLGLTASLHAESPVGSAYLRSLAPPAAPFGRLVQDSYPYDGVRMQRWRRDQPEVDWLTVWLDLQTPGLGYRITPVRYEAWPYGGQAQAVSAQTTLDFLAEASAPPRVDLAVNTVAYFPFPAANGTRVFLSEPVWQGDDNRRNPEPPSPLLGLFPGRARLADAATLRQETPLVAFGGFCHDEQEQDVTDGVAVRDGAVAIQGELPHGRTLAGIGADGRVLILVVADCYNPGVSIGLGRRDAARVLLAAGAQQGIFLDGGGSSTLVARAEDGQPVVLNRPAGLQKTPGTLRYVAVNLGFTNLRRKSDETLPALPDWKAAPAVALWHELVTWARVNQKQALGLAAGAFLLAAVLAGIWLRRRRRAAAS